MSLYSWPAILYELDLGTGQVTRTGDFESVTGFPPEQLATRDDWVALIHPDDRALAWSHAEAQLQSGAPVLVNEYRIIRPDGESRHLRDMATIRRDPSGRPVRLIGCTLDITTQKQAEEALRRSEAELRDAHRQKDELLAVIAHELRNPLAPIHTAAALLERSGVVPAEQRRWLDVIRRQASTLGRLVEDLLDVSRLTRGTLELQRERVDLREVAARAAEAAAGAVSAGAHELHLAAPDHALVVEGDPMRLEQVIVNLLVNAARYTPRGGRIDVELTSLGERLSVKVRDTGIGLSADRLDKVFDLFTQGENTGHRGGGLGIGLSVVRMLARLHGGEARAESDGPGKGATFVVELPRAVAEASLAS